MSDARVLGRSAIDIVQLLNQRPNSVVRVGVWVMATVVFVSLVLWSGIPADDSSFSTYSTWAIAHGRFACAYSPKNVSGMPYGTWPLTYITPTYPLISGALAFVLHLGSSVAFPSSAMMGPHCESAVRVMYAWSVSSGSLAATLRLGLLCWFSLLGGAIALFSSSGRGGTYWEPSALLMLAVSVPTLGALIQFFHPQDVLAVGLSWVAIAMGLRERWILAGVAMGLAIGSNQVALLAAAALLVVIPSVHRRVFTFAAAASLAALVAPFVVASGGRSGLWVLEGSGFTHSMGGTIVWHLHLPTVLMFGVSRFLPLIVALVVSVIVKRHLGALDGPKLISLVAVCFSLRLVFEANLWGYYFVPLATTLVLVETLSHRLRGAVVAWLMLEAITFSPLAYGVTANGQWWGRWIGINGPAALVVIGGGLVIAGVLRRRVRWHWIAFFVLGSASFILGPQVRGLVTFIWPLWFWQIILVPSGMALAAQPLAAAWRTASRERASSRSV